MWLIRRAIVALAAALFWVEPALAAAAPAGMTSDVARTVLILTLLALVPAILVSMTSFIRIVIVLAMVRHAFGMPETPPNAVLVSLALFLTAFTMSPTLSAVNAEAVQPLLAGRIGVEQALEAGSAPLRTFMLAQTRDSDIESIYAIANTPVPERPEQVEILKLAPAFILNELRVAFTIGFVILLPFLVIDLVVSSVLLALGMMMVPPATISLPIKLLMFVLIDGWKLVLEGVLGSFG
jgi:flagellar biosynthetic protein FliP